MRSVSACHEFSRKVVVEGVVEVNERRVGDEVVGVVGVVGGNHALALAFSWYQKTFARDQMKCILEIRTTNHQIFWFSRTNIRPSNRSRTSLNFVHIIAYFTHYTQSSTKTERVCYHQLQQ
jgi:hypothetical protein